MRFRKAFSWQESRNHVLRLSPHVEGYSETRLPSGVLSSNETASKKSQLADGTLPTRSTTLFFRLRNLMTHGPKVSF